MTPEQAFWPVECGESDPDLLVCMSCLSEVYRRKVPMPDCPNCHGVSTYEAFTLDSIRDWGTEDLIHKAGKAKTEPVAVRPHVEESLEPPAEAAE